jgi:hypothetical protein
MRPKYFSSSPPLFSVPNTPAIFLITPHTYLYGITRLQRWLRRFHAIATSSGGVSAADHVFSSNSTGRNSRSRVIPTDLLLLHRAKRDRKVE